MCCVVRGDMDIARIGKAGAELVRSDLSLTGCVNQTEAPDRSPLTEALLTGATRVGILERCQILSWYYLSM
jgi:hypothetical protein